MYWFILVVAIIILSFLREVKQYERGVVLTMGKYTGDAQTGVEYHRAGLSAND